MPSAQARALTLRHQARVLRVAALIARRLRTAALRADAEDIDSWWERIAPRVRQEILTGHSVLAQLGRGYLREHARIEGLRRLRPATVRLSPRRVTTSLLVTGPVAFKTHMRTSGDPAASRRVMADRLQGSAERLVLAGDRDTTLATVRQDNAMVGWRRIPGDSLDETCPFCLMLIGRGGVYSKRTVNFPSHDRCNCSAEPLYRREAEPPEVRRLQEEWLQVTARTSGASSLRAWRRHVVAQRT